jgi:RecA-family ATPase
MRKINGGTIPGNIYFREAARNNSIILSDAEQVKARAVFIDTFAAFSEVKDFNSYSETTNCVRELKQIADSLNIAVILVHHSNKNSDTKDWVNVAMGSQGIVGAADAVMWLNHERCAEDGSLFVTGRKIRESVLKLRWNGGIWEKA